MNETLYDDSVLYDLVHGAFADDESLAFFQAQIALAGDTVLELACGSGHILIPLAEKGVKICGLDISAEMLAKANEKALNQKVKIDVGKGDMRNFELNRKFNLIFIAGNSLQHLTQLSEIEACFKSVKRHLKPNGKFLIEVFNPYIPLLMREIGKRFAVGDYGKICLSEDVNYDSATQINHINWHFWNRTTDEEKMLSFEMRQFFPQELDELFTYNDFRIEQKFGGRDKSAFTSNSLQQIIVASVC